MSFRRVGAHKTIRVIVIVGLTVVTAACHPVFGAASGPVRHATLTSYSGEQFSYQADGDAITALPAAGATDGNVREVFWWSGSSYLSDEQACTTWNTTAASAAQDEPGNQVLQPGLALRIAPVPGSTNGIRAVTVTENIWYFGVWLFNVHVWDSTNTQTPFTLIHTFDLSSIVGEAQLNPDGSVSSTLIPPPWHVCARTQGDTFTFKVWTQNNPEPSWDDPSHVFSTSLPQGWSYPGYSGGYIGHMHAGQSATFSDFTSEPLCVATGTTPCSDDAEPGPTSTSAPAPSSTTVVSPATTLTALDG